MNSRNSKVQVVVVVVPQEAQVLLEVKQVETNLLRMKITKITYHKDYYLKH